MALKKKEAVAIVIHHFNDSTNMFAIIFAVIRTITVWQILFNH